jgi:hypothetical protein
MISASLQQTFDDVEIRIYVEADGGSYFAEMIHLDNSARAELPALPCEELDQIGDAREYGTKLFRWLFRDELLRAFTRARSVAESHTRSASVARALRLRLWLDPNAPKLHSIWWEAMYDSERGEPLSLHNPFSRHVQASVRRWPISERPLRALLVDAEPQQGSTYDLTAIDRELEEKISSATNNPIDQYLTVDRLTQLPNLERLKTQLSGSYHIIHLLAQADEKDGQGFLLFADENGGRHRVPFEEVARVVQNAGMPPYLVFLTAPLSAPEKASETLVSFAPKLIEAGVQAVVAIQAWLPPEMLHPFTERFYDVLIRTGVIDLAVAEARSRIYPLAPSRWSWAFPVLFVQNPDAQLFQPLPNFLEEKFRGIVGKVWRKLAN